MPFSSTFNKLGPLGKIIVIVLSGLVLFFCCFPTASAIIFPGKTPTSAPLQVVEVTDTRRPPVAAPTATLAPEPSATLAPSETPESTAADLERLPTQTPIVNIGVPGLHSADVKTILELKGFKCSGLKKPAAVYIRDCTLDKTVIVYTVSVYGRSFDTVDSVEVMANQLAAPSDDLVAPVFGYVATLSYQNAEPDTARAWVKASLPKLGAGKKHLSAEFGGVKFDLYGEPSARSLDIGVVDTSGANQLAKVPPVKPTQALAIKPTAAPLPTQVPTEVVVPTAAPAIVPTAEPVIAPTQAPTDAPPTLAVDLPPVSGGTTGCCKHCTNSQPCGDSCISLRYTCHKPPGCACP